ncbi:MAG: Mut7-C RNAse domain-containing protein [Deltaproteobacteria bacterium]|nr:Mut7-C RNAse domain-containing protein [Deltaproteobacteria bacterium]
MVYRFIADAMLGKLAKWLRIMGCDVEYFSSISDRELVERAHSSGRIILTRDTLLIRRRKAKNNHFFIHSDRYKEQVKQVVKHFSIDPYAKILTRCILCNEPLINIDKEEIKDKAPIYVYETQNTFETCPSCGRLYWQATHRDKMVRQLEAMLAG